MKVKYAVMEVWAWNRLEGTVAGSVGFIPVFSSKREARKWSKDDASIVRIQARRAKEENDG
jgi:hypothetical protein